MLPRQRQFQDPQSGKLWGTFFDGSTVQVVSGAPGKERTVEKPQSDPFSAFRFLDKEEGARLRKGFMLRNPEAGPGEPRLLRHLGRGYTGALVVAERQGKLISNLFDEATGSDGLWVVNSQGEGEAVLSPGGLVWEMGRGKASVLLLIDHQVKAWNLSTSDLSELTPRPRHPVSFLSCSGSLAAWYDEPEVVVRDLAAGRDLLRVKVEPELVSGHSLQLSGALSPSGDRLAFSAGQGVVELYDVRSGHWLRTICADFAMTERMAFSSDDQRLLAKEKYGRWRLLDFDLEAGVLRDTFAGLGDLGNGDFALDAHGERVAVVSGSRLRMVGLDGSPLLEFRLDQTVKRAALAWTGDGHLAVRTDLGLLGVYAVPMLASPADRGSWTGPDTPIA